MKSIMVPMISLAASKVLAVGDRLAMKMADGAWYIGTVKDVKTKYATVLFDDNDDAKIDKYGDDVQIIRLWNKARKYKKPLTRAELRAYVAEEKERETGANKIVVKPKTTPPKPIKGRSVIEVPIAGPKKAVTTLDGSDKQAPEPFVDKPINRVEDLESFFIAAAKATGTPGDVMLKRIQFMEKMFTFFNRAKFENQLPRAILMLHNDHTVAQDKQNPQLYKAHGLYFPVSGKLSMNEKKFRDTFEGFWTTFLHEMCHMAVDKIDKAREKINQGHGPRWRKWMKRVGLDPVRYALNDIIDEGAELTPTQAAKKMILDGGDTLIPSNKVQPGMDVQFLGSSLLPLTGVTMKKQKLLIKRGARTVENHMVWLILDSQHRIHTIYDFNLFTYRKGFDPAVKNNIMARIKVQLNHEPDTLETQQAGYKPRETQKTRAAKSQQLAINQWLRKVANEGAQNLGEHSLVPTIGTLVQFPTLHGDTNVSVVIRVKSASEVICWRLNGNHDRLEQGANSDCQRTMPTKFLWSYRLHDLEPADAEYYDSICAKVMS